METPPKPLAYGADTDQPYIPDPTKNPAEILLYEIAPKLSSGTATQGEREFYDRERPKHWEPSSAWGNPNPDDKPAADPAQQQQQQPPTTDPTPPTFDVSKFDAHALAVAADEHSDRIVTTIIGLCDKIEAHARETFDAERQRLIAAGINPDEAAATAMQLGEAAQTEKRKEIYQQNEKKLMGFIGELTQREATARQYAATFDCINAPSSLNLCDAHDLGSEKRSRLMEQLSGIGPAAIKGLAALAMQTGDKTLTACLKVMNDRLPKSDRLISSLDLADKIFGEQARAIHQSYVATRTATQRAISFLRQLQTGKSDPNAKISRGLARERAKLASKAEAEAKPGDNIASDHPLSKIRAGLDKGLVSR